MRRVKIIINIYNDIIIALEYSVTVTTEVPNSQLMQLFSSLHKSSRIFFFQGKVSHETEKL